MPGRHPTAEEAVAVLQAAATGDGHAAVQGDQAPLQRHGRDRELPRRAGRIARLDGAVEQRMGLVLVQVPPVLGIDPSHEGVGIEAGRAVQGEDLAGVGVHRDDGAATSCREDARDVALQLQVDRRVDGAPGHRGEYRRGACLAHHVTQGAHLDEPQAVGATQRVVVRALQAVLPHQPAEPHAGEALLRALGFGHLADGPCEVSRDRAIGIVPLRLGLDQQSRDDEAVLFELRHDGELGIRQHQRRQVRGPTVARQHLLRGGAVELQDRCDTRQRRTDHRLVAREQRHCVARHVLRDDLAVAVGDDAARRGQGDRAQPVRLRLQLELAMLKDLRPEERHDQRAQRHPQHGAGDG